jgi:hypothetical protein
MIRRVLTLYAVSALGAGLLSAQQVPNPPSKSAVTAVQKATAPATQQKAAAPQTAAPAPQQKVAMPPAATPPKAAAATPPKAAPATPQKAAPATAQKAATPPRPAAGPAARQVARADSSRVVFTREVYNYPRDGRRDPFASLIATGDIRPIFSDLVITGIMYDPSGRNSLAMLQDVSTNELYRARVGSVFGRIRINAIRLKEVGVSIDEFGFTRQEVLLLNVPSAGRTP